MIDDRTENGYEEGCTRVMRIQIWKNHKRINIDPGEYYVAHEDVLITEKIPLVSSDLGGVVGRVINFYSEDFSVYVRKMVAKGANVVKREEQYWEKSIQKQEETETQIDLW